MNIDWKVDYKNKTASCPLLEVEIKETNKTLAQEFNNHKVAVGFEKAPSQRKYFCKITRMDGSLWEDKELLPNYGIQLGDIFDEDNWDNNI
ncbi:MAG: hypothetical protein KAQ94_03960 [Arcobacteraceae bacterium]|nr:hypothetical protein [Arcobacteraceae bacterium]